MSAPNPPAAWRGHQGVPRTATSLCLALILMTVMGGSLLAAVFSGQRAELASAPYLDLVAVTHGR
jgi:hypothetical protein